MPRSFPATGARRRCIAPSSPASAKRASPSCGWSARSTPDRCWRRLAGRSATTKRATRSSATSGASGPLSPSRPSTRFFGAALAEVAQVDADATYARRLTKDDGLVDWELPAERIHNLIRGLHPWPHAFTFIDGQRLILLRSAASEEAAERTGGHDPRSRRRSSPCRGGCRHREPARDPGRGQAAAARPRIPGGARPACRRGPPSARMIAPARVAAFDILNAVSAGRADLPAAIARSRARLADDRDKALAAEIATGVERWRAALDHLIEASAARPVDRLDPEVTTILRLSAYQLLHLTRVPAAAVVDDAVELTRRAKKRSASGFVNAVLRSLSRIAGVAGTSAAARRHRRPRSGSRLPVRLALSPALAGVSLVRPLRLRGYRTLAPVQQRPRAADASREPAEDRHATSWSSGWLSTASRCRPAASRPTR